MDNIFGDYKKSERTEKVDLMKKYKDAMSKLNSNQTDRFERLLHDIKSTHFNKNVHYALQDPVKQIIAKKIYEFQPISWESYSDEYQLSHNNNLAPYKIYFSKFPYIPTKEKMGEYFAPIIEKPIKETIVQIEEMKSSNVLRKLGTISGTYLSLDTFACKYMNVLIQKETREAFDAALNTFLTEMLEQETDYSEF